MILDLGNQNKSLHRNDVFSALAIAYATGASESVINLINQKIDNEKIHVTSGIHFFLYIGCHDVLSSWLEKRDNDQYDQFLLSEVFERTLMHMDEADFLAKNEFYDAAKKAFPDLIKLADAAQERIKIRPLRTQANHLTKSLLNSSDVAQKMQDEIKNPKKSIM